MNAAPPEISDRELQAWVDDRLDAADRQRVDAAIAADPALRAQAEHLRSQNEALRALFAGELDVPVPARLVAAARGGVPPAAGGPEAAPRATASPLPERPIPTSNDVPRPPASGTAPPGSLAEATPATVTTGGAPARPKAGGAGPAAEATARRAAAVNAPWFRQAAALGASAIIGIALGWFARDLSPNGPGATQAQHGGGDAAPAGADAGPGIGITRAAAVAYSAYAPEVRHPVEVGANEQAHLVAWLSKRLGTSLKVPNLDAQGFGLVGGRLLPDDRGGVAAQFMFENPSGQRLTLFVRRDAPGSDTAFRYAEHRGVGTFYWLDRGFGYALSGELAREPMLSIATAVYRQLNP